MIKAKAADRTGAPSPDSTRQAIIDAARARFARFGPKRTSVADIGKEAGLSRATVYLHFDSKNAIYAALLEQETEKFVDAVTACANGEGSALRKFKSIVETTLEIYAGNPVLLDAARRDAEMTVEEVARSVMTHHEVRITGLLRQVLEQGVEEGDLRPIDTELVAYLMYQLGNRILLGELSGLGAYPFDRLLEAMDDVIAHGIARGIGRQGATGKAGGYKPGRGGKQ